MMIAEGAFQVDCQVELRKTVKMRAVQQVGLGDARIRVIPAGAGQA